MMGPVAMVYLSSRIWRDEGFFSFKTTALVPKEVSVDASIAFRTLEYLLIERRAWNSSGNYVFAFLPTGFGKYLIARWLIQSSAEYF